MRRAVLPIAALAFAAACSGSDEAPTSLTLPESLGTVAPAPVSAVAVAGPIPRCEEVSDDSDSLDYSGPQLGERPNRALTADALDWAMTRGQFLAAWTRDRHETWTIVAVTSEMAELQAEMDGSFPGARVLFMNVDWTDESLAALADEVRGVTALAHDAVGWSLPMGYVKITPPAGFDLTALTSFADRRVCLDA